MSLVLNGSTGITSPGGDTQAAGTTIQGLTVGRGAGAVSTNTAVGASALAAANTGTGGNTALGYYSLAANTSGYQNTAVGQQALRFNDVGYLNAAIGYQSLLNTVGAYNTAVGAYSGNSNTSGNYNTAVGGQALQNNTTASNNTAVGYQAGYSNTTGPANTALGYQAGYANTTGSYNTSLGWAAGQAVTSGIVNTLIGAGCGSLITTGSKNTVIGNYNGFQGGLDIRTASNYIVLSDGDGNPRAYANSLGNWTFPGTNGSIYITGSGYTTNPNAMVLGQYTSTRTYIQAPAGGAVELWDDGTNPIAIFQDDRNVTFSNNISVGGATPTTSGTGITFPATQNASSNANTLDDYEEGSWTPVFSQAGGGGSFTYTAQNGRYVKIGRMVYISAWVRTSAMSGASGEIYVSNLPFAAGTNGSTWQALSIGYVDAASNVTPSAAMIFDASTYVRFWIHSNTNSYSDVNGNYGMVDSGSTFEVYVSGCYQTSS